MEEKETPTYEQLELSAKYWHERSIQLEQNIATINLTTLRLTYLFKVLKYATYFDNEFVQKCVSEIKDIIDIKNPETNNPIEE